jgi:hypothetical protein
MQTVISAVWMATVNVDICAWSTSFFQCDVSLHQGQNNLLSAFFDYNIL